MTPASPSAGATAAPRPSHALAALALALLLGLQPVTTDVYLPALPLLTRELQAPLSGAQLTMSALLLAFGIAQLVWGPIADRVGRRPVLLAGLALYTLASVGAMAAGSIGWLIAWRALQGACLAAAVVVARAMVRDLYEPHEGAQVMALALSGLGVIACLGPLVGGFVTAAWGWRAALAVVALCGAATFAFIAWRLPETLAHKNPQATDPRRLLPAWREIARHPVFLAWAGLTAFSYGGLFVFLAGSSFVYIGMLGLSPAAYGAVMASGSIAYLAGTVVCRRWVPRLGMAGAVKRASWITLAAGAMILGAALLGVHAVWAVLLPQWVFCFAHGVHQPCSQAGVTGPFPRAAGAASALAGFVLALIAFAVGLWLARALAGSVLPFAATLAFWCAAIAVVARGPVQRLA